MWLVIQVMGCSKCLVLPQALRWGRALSVRGVPSIIELSDEGMQEEVSRFCSIWEAEQEIKRVLAVMLKGQELRPQGAE